MTTRELTHVAMSVPEGTLTDECRADLLDFYSTHLGWREIVSLRRADRMTLLVSASCYLNIRERPVAMECHGYEHIGVRVDSLAALADVWSSLDGDPRAVELEPLEQAAGGYGSFRFRYRLPMAFEVQCLPDGVSPEVL